MSIVPSRMSDALPVSAVFACCLKLNLWGFLFFGGRSETQSRTKADMTETENRKNEGGRGGQVISGQETQNRIQLEDSRRENALNVMSI